MCPIVSLLTLPSSRLPNSSLFLPHSRLHSVNTALSSNDSTASIRHVACNQSLTAPAAFPPISLLPIQKSGHHRIHRNTTQPKPTLRQGGPLAFFDRFPQLTTTTTPSHPLSSTLPRQQSIFGLLRVIHPRSEPPHLLFIYNHRCHGPRDPARCQQHLASLEPPAVPANHRPQIRPQPTGPPHEDMHARPAPQPTASTARHP